MTAEPLAPAGRRLAQLARIGVAELAGIGPKRAAALAEAGVETVADLISLYPRRYVDRTRQASVADLEPGQEALLVVTVKRVETRRTRNRRVMVEVDAFDGTGYLRAVFFNQAWRARQLSPGIQAVVFGKLERFRGRHQMTNPVVDLIGDRTGRIIPVYPLSERSGLASWELAAAVTEALERAGPFADPLPERWRKELDLVTRTAAVNQIHAPDSMAAAVVARRRLVLDELLRLQLALVLRKKAAERQARGIRHEVPSPLVEAFHRRLPFPLTGAQTRAIADINADLAGPHPMHRLLQGDVGAGKTLVAVSALLVAVAGGYQGALMAPTEVLAEQHALGIRPLLAGFDLDDAGRLGGRRPLSVGLLTSRTAAAERRRLLADVASGACDLLIGTHALISDGVEFASLGVVVVDEQHRFGVDQRAALRAKGADPDVLVMTATPIPRTAAMTVYGDLDVTVLDELPPGRTPIVTKWLRPPAADPADPAAPAAPAAPAGQMQLEDWAAEAYAKVAEEVAAGHQAFVVCPLVEGSVRVEAASATGEWEWLSAQVWPALRVGLLHGQLAPSAREAVMDTFRRGELDVLVATTVIEVGVDVPNATVMVITDSDRFGMAQLHQLRGRVGRGVSTSWCYLLSRSTTPEAAARLAALESTTDGFALAEVDLDLRGEGTVLGTRQKGRNDLKLASLRRDAEWVARARTVAFDIVNADPGLERHPLLKEELGLLLDPGEAEYLFRS
ncbi:MAG: ATP-dependent DNA helicase RecG [Acidimicrobiales bacterium]